MEYEEVTLPETYVKGYAIRTSNEREQTSEGLIGHTWQRVRQRNITHPAAALFDYENDHTGSFSEIIGEECARDTALTPGEALTCIPAGKYAKFTKRGKMPEIVLTAWQEVWNAEQKGLLTRTYIADFERYPASDVVELYIAIDEKLYK